MLPVFLRIIFLISTELVIFHLQSGTALHVSGSWDPRKTFFLFLGRFGFQKTDLADQPNTQGYIFGNITCRKCESVDEVMLVVVDREYFLEYYGNRTLPDKSIACPRMFRKIDTIAYDATCYDEGQEDFLRKVPCRTSDYCSDEDDPRRVVKGYQFTYVLRDVNQPRFWYLSLVACKRNPAKLTSAGKKRAEHSLQSRGDAEPCKWQFNGNTSIIVDYDMLLVNGNPYVSYRNPLEYQFSFEDVDTAEVYVTALCLYSLLLFIEYWFGWRRQRHHLIKLFMTCLSLEVAGLMCNVVHNLIFAFNGRGILAVQIVGDLTDLFGECLFVLLLILIAKGWTITRQEIPRQAVMFALWLAYVFSYVFLFVWNMTEVSVVSDVDKYQTWPGWFILAFRVVITVWFLGELRSTFLKEERRETLEFYIHFGAGFLVWFISLPIVALVAAQLSALWRKKILLGITTATDILYSAILIHLLWPSRSHPYFQISNDIDDEEFLEEFERERLQEKT